ncbi:MAG: multidrug efflux MFS transporter [Clostridiales bacterium]|nr:multidrug efflux MFS transporter [Clostridiales bacterium]
MSSKKNSKHTLDALLNTNLKVLWFGCFMTGTGLSLIMPILPLYIDTLGKFTQPQLTFWSGAVAAVSFLMTALISPFWGRLADRYGRRPMLLRAALGMSVIMILTAFVGNVVELFIMRALFGLFSGFVSNATALLAAQTPKEESGHVLGTLNTAMISGVLVGPIFGGLIAQLFGYSHIFIVTGSLLFVAFLVTLFMVKENFKPPERKEVQSAKEVFRKLKNPQLIFSLFAATLILQMTNMSVNPILSLYVREVVGNSNNIQILAGIVAAAPGAVSIFAAPRFGDLGDRIGQHKVLIFGFSLAAVVFIPMGFVTNVWQLVGLRLILGVSDAALLPGIQALLARNTPKEATSRIFSYQQSSQAGGSVIGPMLGGAVAGMLDYRYVFFVTSALACVNLVNMIRVTRKAI